MMQNSLNIQCPHCSNDFQVEIRTEPIRKVSNGRPIRDPGRRVDNFVISQRLQQPPVPFETIGERLKEKGVLTPTGKTNWHATGVQRLYEQALSRRAERQATA